MSAELGRWLGGALILVLPTAFWPWNVAEVFTPAKLLCVFALGVPAFLLLNLAGRGKPDPLRGFRLALAFFALLFAATAAIRARGFPPDIVPFLYVTVLPLIYLEIGAAFGQSRADRLRLFTLMGLSAVPVLLLGGAGRVFGWPEVLEAATHGGLPATIGNSNELSDFATPLIPVTLGLAVVGRGWMRPVGWILFATSCALLVWSDSRGALLALGAGLVFLVGGAWSARERDPGLRRIGRLGLIVLVAVSAAALTTPSVRARIESAFDPQNPTVKVRAQVWEGTLEMIGDHLVTGVGAGRYGAAFPPYRQAEEWRLSGTDTVVRDPHNEVLWLLAEGGVAGVVLLITVLALTLGAWRRSAIQPDASLLRPFVLSSLAATAGLCMYHSPFHHPAGALVPCVLVGILAASGTGSQPGGRARLASCVALLVVLVLGALDLDSAQRLEVALRSKDRVSASSDDAVVEALADLTQALEGVASAPIESAARSWRAQHVVRDLLPVRARMEAGGAQVDPERLPGVPLYERLLGQVLELSPHHAGAHNHQAELDWEHERYAEALFRLEDAIKRTPAAPRLRTNLALLLQRQGQIARPLRLLDEEIALYVEAPLSLRARRGHFSLRLGTDVATAGHYLRPTQTEQQVKELREAEILLTAGDAQAARTLVLAHLGDHPACHEALNFVASLGFGELRENDEARQEANHAVARTKLLNAADLERSGEYRLARRNLDLVPPKDPELNDAQLLRARIAAGEGAVEKVMEALKALRERGFAPKDLRFHCEKHEGLRKLMEAGRLDGALKGG